MNCKEGDLAIVVCAHAACAWALGRIVQCKSMTVQDGVTAWILEEPLLSPSSHPDRIVWECIADSYLRSLQSAGDKAHLQLPDAMHQTT